MIKIAFISLLICAVVASLVTFVVARKPQDKLVALIVTAGLATAIVLAK